MSTKTKKPVIRTEHIINKEIEHAVEARERFGIAARAAEDKDEREGLYINIDCCNDVISGLLDEKAKL